MFALRLFFMAFIVLVLAVIITQILVPMLQGTKLFPIFRKTRISLEGQLAEVREQLTDKALQEELDELKAQLKPVVAKVETKVDSVVQEVK